MRVEDEKLALTQFPGIVYAHNAIGILSASIHDGTSHLLQMLPYHLTLFHYLLPIGHMQDPAIVIGQALHHPCHFSRTDPFLRIVEFILAAQVDAINQGLDLRDGEHARQAEVSLEGEPGEEGLQTAIGTSPPVIIKGLVAVMVVLVKPFHIVLDVFLFGNGADEGVRIKEFLRVQGDCPFRRL